MSRTDGWDEPKDRVVSRMEGIAEALPRCVASRDAKAVEALLCRARTLIETRAVAVILADWVARLEAISEDERNPRKAAASPPKGRRAA